MSSPTRRVGSLGYPNRLLAGWETGKQPSEPSFGVPCRPIMESMKSPNRALVLWLPVMLAALMGGCSTGARVTAVRALAPLPGADPNMLATTNPNPPTAVSQATGSCWNTISCCVQNHPLTPVQSCGADPLEAAKILEALGQLEAAARVLEAAGRLPKWKKECINTYYECLNKGWVGTWNCVDCLRFCEGQQGKWPKDRCFPPEEQG
jgi:hypothetical protein